MYKSVGRSGLIISLVISNLLLVWGVLAMGVEPRGGAAASFTPGDPLPRISCTDGYEAFIYAEGLASPDGLALAANGLLYVAQEASGEVSQVGATGIVTSLVTGLNNPEGLTLDSSGNLYIVEDANGGRLLQYQPNGTLITITTGLVGAENVTWSASGTPLHVTESNVEYITDPFDAKSWVTAIQLNGNKNRLITATPQITFPYVRFISYAGITWGPNGLLYLSNEAAGIQISQPPFILTTTTSILTLNPTTIAQNIFVIGLTSPEGIRFAPDGNFPLYVVEEDLGNGDGWLSQITANGVVTPFCSGFQTIEDVQPAPDGSFFVSEDSTGLIIRLAPPPDDPAIFLPLLLNQ